jgi:SAM-dependent methyltransferase
MKESAGDRNRGACGRSAPPYPPGASDLIYDLEGHYRIERELAGRLRHASRGERRALYTAVYEELFQRVPGHPQLRARDEFASLARRHREVERQAAFLQPFLGRGEVFMEVGAGDCALSVAMAPHARKVLAIDVAEDIVRKRGLPENFQLILSDGCSIPVPPGSVQLAFSDQLMEHLHPEDAAAQLVEICRALAPGGRYVCITPNKLYGPSDVSGAFDAIASGLHLREYTAGELTALLREAGLGKLTFYVGARGKYLKCPARIILLLEGLLSSLPHRLCRSLARLAPMRALLGLRVVAEKQ